MEYILLESSEIGDLSNKVTEKLGQGFILYGNPFFSPYKTETAEYQYYCQAVTKK